MKAIIKSVFLTAILALAVTGCQKESDDLNVSLKSATVDFVGGTFGGTYYYDWTSGNAEAECALAGGCDGGSYKIDSGVDAGVYFDEGGVTVTGINKQMFSWTSEYPVCKIIVKAGRGAYVFDIGGAQSGTVPYPTDLNVKAKDISHITFCFGPRPDWVIALKSYMTSNWAATSTAKYTFTGYYDFIPGYKGYKIFYSDESTPVGNLEIGNFDDDPLLEVMIDNTDWTGPELLFTDAYLFVGTVEEYLSLRQQDVYFYYQFPYKTGIISPAKAVVIIDLPF